ncbi:N(5)-(carboxyethyl)ornithine synthase [Mycolicibacterium sp. P1-5]|uniref:N(5)-(carboxyethyl)ornithine synthase n=1 Tax=Mycolicibacterium sp. P1-5 TaxID=2024617 RepID=UPI0011EBA279|nr:N(5)-(carboxyethyl)ornithine synthase [Mycolicibacterium sp. P1-5]KAA0108163.1 alanine dehydrogenase [Mycolicibacterium sp. P1-5]
MSQLNLGVIGATHKENERRLPIHPHHFDRISAELRGRIYLEHGYAERFGVSDGQLSALVAGVRSREDLIAECDVILLLKPDARDLVELRTGQVLWGWPHCVQDEELTQQALDRRQTLIAFEAMNLWSRAGSFKLHVFHKNNELAGYCSVLHAMSIVGSSGTYGRRRRAAVLGFGATARGAVTALSALGVHDVDILTNRDVTEVASPIHSARIVHFDHEANSFGGSPATFAVTEEGRVPLAGYLAEHDIIVNCVLQDTNAPLIFLDDDDLAALRPNGLIVDVSCDEAMGFSWARPTSFEQPTFVVGPNVTYYAVDHSPSYLWDSSTWEISEALLPYLPTVLAGSDAWQADETVRRAIEILDGAVLNPNILSFQNRQTHYPYVRRGPGGPELA